ncbi:MAG: DUF2130 domain-containing protein [Defluviitaleaceae bacterium]|nr:DUF2130 domain-containing protein [Defluviitaleaceae bacterium]
MQNKTIITCPKCNVPFEMSDAIQSQIASELEKAKEEQKETLNKQYNIHLQAAVTREVDAAVTKTKQAAALDIERLRIQAKSLEESEKQNRNEVKNLLEELSRERKSKEEAEIAARKDLLAKEKLIRDEAVQSAADNYNTKIREQEEVINRLREQLTNAKQLAEQGSQQLQGEILELDIEKMLRVTFPYDGIEEVKKGERGSDIRQRVNEQFAQNCGLILWECKNAKTFQNPWLSKLKDEIAAEKAQVGVIVFNSPDRDSEDFKQLADNVWLVKPRYATLLASVLRDMLINIYMVNRNTQGKDVKMDMIYSYLTGGEFANRVRYILESYEELSKQLDAEKKQTIKRWAATEKMLARVNSGIYGLSGDLEGIAGQEIVPLFLENGNTESLEIGGNQNV